MDPIINININFIITYMITKGIVNSGNDCYLIASLQLLCRIYPIVNLFTNLQPKYKELKNTITMMLDGHTINKSQTQYIRSLFGFNDGLQHDSFDFLTLVLDKINNNKIGTDIKKKLYPVTQRQDLITNIYKHKYYSSNITHYNIIELQINDNNLVHKTGQDVTLSDMLLEQDSYYICRNIDTVKLHVINYKSKNATNAYEVTDYYPTKNVIIRLQLFSENNKKIFHNIKLYDSYNEKHHYHINFNGIIYKLVSIISHIGSSINSGHYVCYTFDICKNDGLSYWYNYDDAHVSKNKNLSVIGEPYILLYVRATH